ncbi:MAG: MFS transporter [Candidatus Adiutricales bacterium]
MSDSSIVSKVKAKIQNMFYGWRIVFFGFFINAFGVGTFFYGFSTFFNPMTEEFGWSRAKMAGVYSLSRLEGGIEGPLVGWLIDRFGARKLLLIGCVMTGFGFILISQISSLWHLYLVFGIILSIGYNMGFSHGTGAVIAKWFIRKRGRALSILITGNGIGGAVFVPLIAFLIVTFGWRWAITIVGISTFLIPLPLSFFMRSTPEKMGLVPDGEPLTAASSMDSDENEMLLEETDFTVLEALRTRAFWIYVGSMVLRSCILSSIVVHQIPHLTDIGIPYQQASRVLGLMVLFSVPGRFVFGWLGDRFDKRILLFLLCLQQGLGLFIFVNARTIELLYLFVLVYGLSYGGVIPLTIALRADLFGRRNYATIAGVSQFFSMFGTVVAPVLAGLLYDKTQSYAIAFYIFIALIILSGVLFMLLPRSSVQAKRPVEA